MRHRIYLARHGETEWNALGKLQGATDVPLNDIGKAQASALGERLQGRGVSLVVTSDLSRSEKTGAIAAAVLGIDDTNVQMDHELRERSFGIFEGLTREECAARYPAEWQDWQARTIAPPDAEPVDRVVARMRRSIARIFDHEKERVTLVISHGGAMRLLLSDLVGTPMPLIANGAVYEIEIADPTEDVFTWKAQAWNPGS